MRQFTMCSCHNGLDTFFSEVVVAQMDLFHFLAIPEDIAKFFRSIVPKLVVEKFEDPEIWALFAELDNALHPCNRESIP